MPTEPLHSEKQISNAFSCKLFHKNKLLSLDSLDQDWLRVASSLRLIYIQSSDKLKNLIASNFS